MPIGTEDVSRHDTTVRYVYRGAEFLLETSTYSNALNVGASKFVDVSMETQYRDTSSAHGRAVKQGPARSPDHCTGASESATVDYTKDGILGRTERNRELHNPCI